MLLNVHASAATSMIEKIDVLPQPQQVRFFGKRFEPARAKVITVTDVAQNRFNARILRQALRQTFNIDCEILLLPAGADSANRLALTNDLAGAMAWPIPANGDEEGYALQVGESGAAITAKAGAGLLYGVQTLIQLIEQAGREKGGIPGMAITDWPTYRLRGAYLDGDQYMGSIRVTRSGLAAMIQRMSRFKMNYLVIEMYNLMPFKSFPYCADENTLSLADWNYLVELASLQSFAQMYDVLWPREEGKPYREGDAVWPGIICPSRPIKMELLKGLYKDLLTVFKHTPFLGIGCSEVGMSWKQFCPLCQKRLDSGETLNDIYEKHVRDCVRLVKSAAKELHREVRPWMWADEFYMAYKHRDYNNFTGMELIPKDVVMCHWAYWSKIWSKPTIGEYEGIRGLLQHGYDVSFASASYLYNTYLLDLSPDDPAESTTNYFDPTRKFYLTLDSGIFNITDQARCAKTYQEQVKSNKVLGGLCATFSQHDIKCWDTIWYAYALHADYTWGDPMRRLRDYKNRFTYLFATIFYDTRDCKTANTIADAFFKLDAAKSDIERNNYLIRDVMGEYDIQDSAYLDNTLDTSLELIRKLMEHPQGPGASIADVRSRAEHVHATAIAVRSDLAKLAPSLRNQESWSYLLTSAKKIENHAARTIYMLDQELVLKNATAGYDLDALDKLAARLAVLRNETRLIADEANELTWGRGVSAAPWSPSGDATGFNYVIKMLDEFAARLSACRSKASAHH